MDIRVLTRVTAKGMSTMSVGPPEDYHEDDLGPDDAAMPTRPSERGAWRHHWAEDDAADEAIEETPAPRRRA